MIWFNVIMNCYMIQRESKRALARLGHTEYVLLSKMNDLYFFRLFQCKFSNLNKRFSKEILPEVGILLGGEG